MKIKNKIKTLYKRHKKRETRIMTLGWVEYSRYGFIKFFYQTGRRIHTVQRSLRFLKTDLFKPKSKLKLKLECVFILFGEV